LSVLENQSVIELSSSPVRVDGSEPLDVAARLMAQHHIGSLVVDAGGQPAGLITDRDVALAALQRPAGTPLPRVDEVASMPLMTLPSTVSIEEAALFFGEQCVRRVGLVSAEGALLGVLSSDTVLTFTATLLRTLADGIEHGFSEERNPSGSSSLSVGTE
jgi:CBS domain-containing protein